MMAFNEADLAAFRDALALPAEADEAAILGGIVARRLVREAKTLDQVRSWLGLPANATALACAAELCARLPPGWHHTAVLAMQLVEVLEQERWAQVKMLRLDAIAAARGGLAG